MKGKFYKLEGIPNNTVYVYEVTKTDIKFLAFFNGNNKGLEAIPHTASIKLKKDFKKIKGCFNPCDSLMQLINEFLN
jgi:hypothetical protein